VLNAPLSTTTHVSIPTFAHTASGLAIMHTLKCTHNTITSQFHLPPIHHLFPPIAISMLPSHLQGHHFIRLISFVTSCSYTNVHVSRPFNS
jgi:hypothetical protein